MKPALYDAVTQYAFKALLSISSNTLQACYFKVTNLHWNLLIFVWNEELTSQKLSVKIRDNRGATANKNITAACECTYSYDIRVPDFLCFYLLLLLTTAVPNLFFYLEQPNAAVSIHPERVSNMCCNVNFKIWVNSCHLMKKDRHICWCQWKSYKNILCLED